MTQGTFECELCKTLGGELLAQDEQSRVVLVDEPDYPGMCRVILARHVAEMTDLAPARRRDLLAVVLATEQAVREVVKPDKVNLASLGNLVPHLHWHVIPRWRDDPCFPKPIWAPAERARVARARPSELASALREALARALAMR